jgi:hypothetical protein
MLIVMAVMLGLLGWLPAGATSIHPLDVNQAAYYGATHMLEITAADLTTAATNTAQTITNVFYVASNSTVALVAMELVEEFSDDATNAFNSVTVSVGDGTDTDLYLQTTELAKYGSTVWIKPGRMWEATNTTVACITGLTSVSSSFLAGLTTNLVAYMTNMTLYTTTLTGMAEHVGIGTTDVTVVTQVVALAANGMSSIVQVKSNGVVTITTATSDAAQSGSAYGPKTYTADDTVDFVFTPVATYGLAALDNGKVRFYFRVMNRPRE